jgi:hypothetical protein
MGGAYVVAWVLYSMMLLRWRARDAVQAGDRASAILALARADWIAEWSDSPELAHACTALQVTSDRSPPRKRRLALHSAVARGAEETRRFHICMNRSAADHDAADVSEMRC